MNLAAWLLWILPLTATPLVPLLSKSGRRLVETFACVVAAISACLSMVTVVNYSSPTTERLSSWLSIMGIFIEVKIDGVSVLLSAFISFLSFLIVLYSVGYMAHSESYVRYYSLILLFIGSMLGLVMAGNFVQLYFFWELVGICSALLIAFYNERESARRAGFKAFLVTRIGDAAFLIAIILTYAYTGTTNIDAAIRALRDVSGLGVMMVLIPLLFMIGAMAKSAQVPLHVWLPDAMEGPTPVSALIHAATMVNAGVYLMVRLFPILADLPSLLILAQCVGIASLLLGALCAVVSTDIKRVLAYSTISQIGLMFYSIGLGFWRGSIYHLISQGIFKALGFLAAGSVITIIGTGNIDELGGLKKYMKYTYYSFIFAVITMSGFPPFIGFWSKDAILAATFGRGWALTSIIALSSLLTTIYSFRVLFRAFHGDVKIKSTPCDPPMVMLVPMFVLVFLTFASWPLLAVQELVDFSFSLHLSLEILFITLSALIPGLCLTFFIINRYKNVFDKFVNSSELLIRLRTILLFGFGFDLVYLKIVNRIMPTLYSWAKRIQTGSLNINMLYVAAVMIVLMVLFVGGGL